AGPKRIDVAEISVISPNETARTWRASRHEPAVQLYLSGVEGDAAALANARVAGFPLGLNIIPTADWIEPSDLAGAAAAVIQVDTDSAASVKRFQKLALASATPLIAAAFEPPLALIRSLVRAGAHDVLPLPLAIVDLEAALAPIRDELKKRQKIAGTTHAKVV